MCMFCWSLFVLLCFFVWPLCCLFFFNIRILITPLLSSNSSYQESSINHERNYLCLFNAVSLTFFCFHFLWCSSRYDIVSVLTAHHRQYTYIDDYEEFDNTKRVTINRISKNQHCNGRKKIDNMTSNHLQNTTQKTKDWTSQTLRKTVDDVRCFGKVSNWFSPKGNRRITVLPLYGLSSIHYKITNRIFFQVKLLLCVIECRHIWEHTFIKLKT